MKDLGTRSITVDENTASRNTPRAHTLTDSIGLTSLPKAQTLPCFAPSSACGSRLASYLGGAPYTGLTARATSDRQMTNTKQVTNTAMARRAIPSAMLFRDL